jgi:hypothetical protein
MEALPDLAKDFKAGDEQRTIVVTVRDEVGKSLFRASLTLDAG